MEEELLLEEQDRVKLDGIVSQMESNGESTEDIQFVVSDFKQKYGKPSTPSSDIPDPVDTALPESEPLKKKEESQSSVYQSPSGNSDSVLVSDGEDEDFLHGLIKDRFPKFAAWRKENRRSFNAATNEALAGVSGIPNLLNQSLFSAFAPDELKEEIDSMEPESRETVINSFLSLGGPVGVNPGLLGMASDQAQEKLLEKANNIRANMEQFDTSINQDFAEGNYTQAMKRVGTEGIGSIPSVVQAMIPYVGIPSIIGGSAANKLEEEEEEGNIGDDVVLNSWVNGTAEGLLELVTKKIGGRVLKSMKATPKKSKTILESVVTGLGAAGEEGLSEAATTYIQNLSDEIIQGKDVDWDQHGMNKGFLYYWSSSWWWTGWSTSFIRCG